MRLVLPLALVALLSISVGAPVRATKPIHVLLCSMLIPARVFPLAELGAELTARGHTATIFVSSDLAARAQRGGTNVIDVGDIPLTEYKAASEVLSRTGTDSWEAMTLVKEAVESATVEMTVAVWEPTRAYLEAHEVDVLVCDFAASYCPRLARMYGKRFVFFAPLMLSGFFGLDDASGLTTASYQPNSVFTFDTGRSLLGRAVQRVLQHATLWAVGSYHGMHVKLDAMLRDFGEYNGDPHCANQHRWSTCATPRWVIGSLWQLEEPVPLYPNAELVGPAISTARPPLGNALHAWLDRDDGDVLYVCLGTSAILTHAHVRLMSASLDRVLGAAPHARVLWSLPARFTEHVPAALAAHTRVRMETWVPQKSVLAHERVAAFVSQCGSNSMHDGLFFGVPTLCVPIFTDQHSNAERVARTGGGAAFHAFARSGGSSDVAADMADAMQHVLVSESLRAGAERMRYAYARAGGVRRFADIVEDVVVLGDEYLVAWALREQNRLQRHDVDVWAVLGAVAAALVWGGVAVCRACVRRVHGVRRMRSKRKDE